MHIKLSKCSISSWKMAFKEDLVLHANNPQIARYMRDGFPSPYTEKDAIFWIESNLKDSSSTNFALLVDGKFAGTIGLMLKEDIHRCNAEIGYWIGESYWGQGIVSEAVLFMVEYAFEQFDISRLYAGVFEGNSASMKVLEKTGFKLESIHRKAVIKNGILYDEYIYTILSA